MSVVEPIVSEVHMAAGVWLATVTDSDGEQPEWDRGARHAWAGDMVQASHVLAALGDEPRTLIICHPSGYGQPRR